MTHKEYISNPDVQALVQFIAEKYEVGFKYNLKATDKVIESVKEAFENYVWNKNDYNTNKTELESLKSKLNSAYSAKNEDQLKEACIEVLDWGKVKNKNDKYVTDNNMLELINQISKLWNDLTENKISISDIKEISKSNAGFTKIYSLLFNDFIIYDSRVAAALALLMKQCFVGKIPEILRIDLPQGRDTKSGKGRRNPDETLFKSFTKNDSKHFKSNVKASWVLQEVTKKIIDVDTRKLEAALFMIGYDVRD